MASGRDKRRAEPQSRAHREESFVARWARRKRAAAAAECAPETTPVQPPPEAAALEAGDEPREPTDAELPPIETLDENSDYSGFLSPRVSDALRRQALRKLFTSAKFNVVDGLDDYAEDYRSFEALGDMITADMRHDMERLAAKAREGAEGRGPSDPRGETVAQAPADESADGELPTSDQDPEVSGDDSSRA